MDVRYPHPHSAPSYAEFLNEYLLPNKPVIIGPSLISSWPALVRWTDEDGSINWDYLKTAYGSCEVTVADCSTRDFSDQKREQMLFRDVVSLWQAGQGQSLYVKDWHLARTLATASHSVQGESGLNTDPFYTTPDIFRDDWMNAYYSARTSDDFRFVYVGAAWTFTPLHRDVYTSYSWSTNVCGRKRWWLFPPDQTQLLFRKGGGEHLETAYDVRDVDSTAYPLFSKARPLVVEQGTYMNWATTSPSGWYHQVENLTACISVNHNWCNSVNLPSLYDSMCAKVTEVEHALEDVKQFLSEAATSEATDASASDSRRSWENEWIAIVQDVVEKDAGWNWLTFWCMVRHALALAMERPHPENEDLWPRTPPELMPPLYFIKERIRACRDNFVQRPQREVGLVPTLGAVLADIHQLLDTTK